MEEKIRKICGIIVSDKIYNKIVFRVSKLILLLILISVPIFSVEEKLRKFYQKSFLHINKADVNAEFIKDLIIVGLVTIIAALVIFVIIILFRRKLKKEIKEKDAISNKLKEGEINYKLLAENVIECIWLLDLSIMKFKYISPSILQLRGVTVEEAMNEKLEDSLTPESVKKIGEITKIRMDKYLSGDRSLETMEGINEFQQYHKDGHLIDVEISTKYIFDEKTKVMDVLGVSRDITERKKLEQKLEKEMNEKNMLIEIISTSEKELRELLTIIEYSPISVVIADKEAKIIYGNKAVYTLSGYTKEEVMGKNPRIFQSGYHPAEFYKEMWKEIRSGNEWHGEFRNQKKSGEIYWERVIIIPVKNENGEIYRYLSLKEDITEKKQQLELLKYHAERDPLTKAYNRRAGLDFLRKRMSISKENKEKLVICFMDLNKLKYTNDTFGHEAGDDMIKTFAKVISNSLRQKDIFFRMGGDEFLIIFNSCTFEVAEEVWLRIKETMDELNSSKVKSYTLSVSHGTVEYDENKHKTIDELIAEADIEMYIEKNKQKLVNED